MEAHHTHLTMMMMMISDTIHTTMIQTTTDTVTDRQQLLRERNKIYHRKYLDKVYADPVKKKHFDMVNAASARRRYRNNPDIRERMRKYALERYYRLKNINNDII